MRRKIIYKCIVRFFLFCLVSAVPAAVTGKSIKQAQPSLDYKIGQMILIGFRGYDLHGNENLRIVEKQLKESRIGGIIILNDNIRNRIQLKNLVKHLKTTAGKNKLLVAIDQEGGKVTRLSMSKGFTEIPSHREVASRCSGNEAFNYYKSNAELLKDLGINLNLGPVLDLDINPKSPAIGRYERSFSKDPYTVAFYAEMFITAHHETGILTAAKHFPGHGSAKNDTHEGLTDITDTFVSDELLPYRLLNRKKLLDMVMSSHVMHKKIDSLYPASLSEKHIDLVLRKTLGYKGIVLSDDLQMKSVSQYYNLEKTVILAVNAGNDLLLFSNYFYPDPHIPEKVAKIIKKALQDGLINPSRIDEAYERIRALKEKL